jgi:hypothetical protein
MSMWGIHDENCPDSKNGQHKYDRDGRIDNFRFHQDVYWKCRYCGDVWVEEISYDDDASGEDY